MTENNENTQPKQYVTTTLPYVNADPHIGFAFEITQADAYARFKRLTGHEGFFNMGADEHGEKIWRNAQAEGRDVQAYVDHYAKQFDKLKAKLNASYNNFIRTTDSDHKKAAQEFWRRCDDNGDIYKKEYEGLYCVGCEMFVTEKDLDANGRCPDHPDRKPEAISEENYFFRFSHYEDALLSLYEDQPDFVVPDRRFNEIKQFVQDGLEDFSISRKKDKLPWGVPVPGDDDQGMYVWFDALVNYISTLGWPENQKQFTEFWRQGNPVQFAGKDQIRQQAAMWQAMLMSAGLPNTNQIFLHGFINVDGQKMSKSIGNVVNPYDLVDEFGTDVVRYYLLRHIHPDEDSNFTLDKLTEAYNGSLANGLGNTVSRIASMYSSYDVDVAFDQEAAMQDEDLEILTEHMNNFRFDQAMDYIWQEVSHLDAFITDREPYKGIKSDDEDDVREAKEAVAYLALRLFDIAEMLKPFMPETSEEIQDILKEGRDPEPLFERKE
ncbi:MAG: methionine--tRNA ligase [Parcubacteria group bacterium SW_6_46_9]|nr:MAG: methionine--tRNA ligase [Parcubacteria group bacterium SW_6_46_9]